MFNIAVVWPSNNYFNLLSMHRPSNDYFIYSVCTDLWFFQMFNLFTLYVQSTM